MRFPAVLLATVPFLLAADTKSAADKEIQKMQGTWHFTSIKSDGKNLDEDTVKGARLTITGKRFLFRVGTAVHSGTIEVDPTQKPKTIDVAFTSGDDKGKTALGVYELKGDSLKVCMGVPGTTRPVNFASRPGTGHVLEVMTRNK